jgi:hypothetical protein
MTQKSDSERDERTQGEAVSYGHVYQFSSYIEITTSHFELMMIYESLTGYKTTTTSAAIPTEAETSR